MWIYHCHHVMSTVKLCLFCRGVGGSGNRGANISFEEYSRVQRQMEVGAQRLDEGRIDHKTIRRQEHYKVSRIFCDQKFTSKIKK